MPPSEQPAQGQSDISVSLRGSGSAGNGAEAPRQDRESAAPLDAPDESTLVDIVRWVEENQGRIHKWARGWEENPEEALQLGQEILAKILQAGPGKKVKYPGAYVWRVGWRVACGHWARKAKSPKLVALDADHEAISDGVSVERICGLRSIVRSVISKLSRRQKQVIWYRYYEGQAWEDVASEMGISETVAKKYHGKAVSNLRKGLSAMGITKEDWRKQLDP
ncbi:sigma-70 family RNA polymerase sigma factor [Streptomyces olivaceus]|uniref:sigma-70 family RNA polymerase sigma factor n=1 Tax=Streptomyces olivaceus TaxID=47716 RepID=UPI001CCAC4FD|nr:sigma-70 family RNA polymerase sigma factor [Streptomyces olivaceus]MBZ6171210.1 sigma-70 family RNA polymerase sigma factor [Streptomyces olivaceus]MBZ6178179.1 sigma-70 family RNA polymerase sigma factor [Streptomyces olivaceus]